MTTPVLQSAVTTLRAQPAGIYTQVSQSLRRGQTRLALSQFHKSLRAADPDELAGCVQLFGLRNGKANGSAMLEAFKAFTRYGYVASTKLWTRLLQIAPLTLQDVQTLTGEGRFGWVQDEEALCAIIKVCARNQEADLAEAAFMSSRQITLADGCGMLPGARTHATLITAFGNSGNVKRAKFWFNTWRKSIVHPSISTRGESKSGETSQISAKLSSIPTFLLGTPVVSRLPRQSMSRNAHVLRVLPAPDPAPYVALLEALSEKLHKLDRSALELIELMAADRLPLDTAVINALMNYELCKEQAGAPSSIFNLYERLGVRYEAGNASAKPDAITFSHVFKAYKEPYLNDGGPKPPPMPTKLARAAEFGPPPEDITRNPRKVVRDLLNSEIPVTAWLLEEALQAFIQRRDFLGASIMLALNPALRIEPTSRMHALVVRGTLRADGRGEAFQSASSKAWLSASKREELIQRVTSMNELSGYGAYPPQSRVQIVRVKPMSRDLDSFDVSHDTQDTSDQSEFWNGREKHRFKSELRNTRRYNLRDIDYLLELLFMADPYQFDTEKLQMHLGQAVSEVCPQFIASRLPMAKMIQILKG